MEIKELHTGDRDAAIELWRRCGLLRPWNDPHADLELALSEPTSTVLAGYDGDRLIATVMVGCDGHRGWVYYLAVDPEAQRRGLGAAMMRAAEDWVGKRGMPKLNLMFRGDNAVVAAFYEKLGYARSDVAVMQRVLERTTC